MEMSVTVLMWVNWGGRKGRVKGSRRFSEAFGEVRRRYGRFGGGSGIYDVKLSYKGENG